MRKYLFIILIALIPAGLFAQGNTNAAIAAFQEKDFSKAKALIDEAIASEAENTLVKTWFVRGEIYYTIGSSDEAAINSLDLRALDIALESYQKVMKMDVAKEHTTNCIKRLKTLSLLFFNRGVKEFNVSKFDNALSSFENAMTINKRPDVLKVDTTLYYNAAKAAEKIGQYDKSIKYYEELIKLSYQGANIYENLAIVFDLKGDMESYETILKKGITNFPNDNLKLIKMIINYYLGKSDYESSQVYLEMAIKQENDFAPFHYVLGNIYERKGDIEKAIVSYINAVEFDRKHFEANFNLGVIYYNKAAKEIEKVNAIIDKDEYAIAKEKIDNHFKNSLVYYENAILAKPDDTETLHALEFLYERLKMDDKLKETRLKLGTSN